ncbi:MAG: hypothetical protein BGP12_14310 [Rhodospirillales bacterium 70-18]|nr:hypothetical protein [Rhodospirillales bacterium]OJY67309.1 MAG: hypothetical protein BGP12_14310 [Rhodospirillales bacterium 70-18]
MMGALLGGFAVGVLLGAAHFGSLWWNTRLYAGGAAGRALAMQMLRIGVLVAVLAVLARFGAVALLAGAAGLLLARAVLVRRLGGAR